MGSIVAQFALLMGRLLAIMQADYGEADRPMAGPIRRGII